MIWIAGLLLAAQSHSNVGTVVQARGAGSLSCATAFLPQSRLATENWIAGFWAAWDMAMIKTDKPVAGGADLAGIVGEVEKVCRNEPSSGLLFATMAARKAVKARWRAVR